MEALKMSTWNDDKLDDLSRRTDAGFKEVKAEIRDVRQEMKDGFAQIRGEMNQRFNTLTALIGTLIVAVLGTGIFG